MNFKNVALLIIVIIIIAGGALSFYYYRDNIINKFSQKTQDTNITLATELKIEDKRITDETKPFKIDIAYPYITDANEFNNLVKNLVDKELNDFKTISLENDQAVKEIDPVSYAEYPREYALNIDYTKGQIDENIVSIILNVYNFTGGAHGAGYFLPVNYDLENRKEIKLEDLYPAKTSYLKKISALCEAEITKQIIERAGNEGVNAEWIADGTAPEEKNYSVFLVNKDNITFYFPQYQVAAYAFGDFKVVVPR